MSISYLAYFGAFTRLMPSKAPVSASLPPTALSIATEAEFGPKPWWMEVQPFSSRFPVTGAEDHGHIGTHFDGGRRPQRRGTNADGSGGLQPDQRGCRDP